MSLADAATYAGLGVLALVILWVAWLFYVRVQDQEAAQRMADAAFEAQILGSLQSEAQDSRFQPRADFSALPNTAVQNTNAFPDYAEIPAAAAPEPAAQPYVPSPELVAPTVTGSPLLDSATDDYFRQPADLTCAAVINQFRNAGMMEQIDSFIEVNGNTKGGVVLRLRGGKRALLLPYFESEPFALRNLKRFDQVVFVGRTGKAVVLTSLEEVIAAKVSGSMGGF